MIKYIFFLSMFLASTVSAQHKWYRTLSVGSNSLVGSSIFDVNSTVMGSTPCPVMTEAERDAIGTPDKGLCVFNSTSNLLNNFNGTIWVASGGGGGGGDLWSDPVDADIVPDAANTRDLGTLANPFELGNIDRVFVTDGVGGATGSLDLGSNLLSISGFLIRTQATDIPLTIQTLNDSDANADPTQNVYILSGNKLAGTGDSGDIIAQTGTSAGGARGQFVYKDGTEGTSGDVLTSTGILGEVSWITPAGGGGDLWSDPVDSSITLDADVTYDIGTATESVRDIYLKSLRTINGGIAIDFSTGGAKLVGNLTMNDSSRSIGNSSNPVLNVYVSAIRSGSLVAIDISNRLLKDSSGTNMVNWGAGRVDMAASTGPARVPNLAADPGSPVNGDMWYNTTDDKFRIRANAVTVDLN